MPGGPDASLQAQSSNIVLWTSRVPTGNIHGDWVRVADSTAAGGAALRNPNRSRAKVAPASASPADYFEISFTASAGVPYYVWLRMRADSNSWSNDSVHVQFNRSVDASGRAVARIGTTGSLEAVLQSGSGGSAPSGWGWTSNGWEAPPTPVYFSASGTQILRVQRREDGTTIDQIVLSPSASSPGARTNDTRILTSTDGSGTVTGTATSTSAATRVIWASALSSSQRYGDWARVSDSTAAGGAALRNPNRNRSKVAPALSNPANFFEATFQADAGRSYHVWIRGRADSDSTSNDSVHLQFSDSLTTSGSSFARIGTSSSMEFVLQAGAGGARPLAWGWTDNGWGSLGSHLRFATTGTHTVRVQQREDGMTIDQIVISPDTYLTTPPGVRRSDTRILPATSTTTTTNQLPTVSLTSPTNGATFAAGATIAMAASASDPEGRMARVEFYNGTTRLGTDTTAPYTYSWAAVPGGSYSLRAIAFDADGGQRASTTATVTVGSAPAPAPGTRTWMVVFGASSNHATAVTSYRVEVFASGANPDTATPVRTSDLGKPTPNSNNEISVDRSTFFNGLTAGTYGVVVRAIGSAGTSRSNLYSVTR